MSASTGSQARHRLGDYLLLGAVVLVAWQLVSMLAGSTTISSPWSAFATAAELVTSEDFPPNVFSTMRAFLIATVIAVAGGTFIGLALGANRLLGDAYEPMLMSFYTVPKVAFSRSFCSSSASDFRPRWYLVSSTASCQSRSSRSTQCETSVACSSKRHLPLGSAEVKRHSRSSFPQLPPRYLQEPEWGSP